MIENVAAPESLRDVDLALDTEEDFAFAAWLADEVTDDAGLKTIIDAARRYGVRQAESVT